MKHNGTDSPHKTTVIQGLTKDQLINSMNACNHVRDNYKPNAKLSREQLQERIARYNNRYVKPTHEELNDY